MVHFVPIAQCAFSLEGWYVFCELRVTFLVFPTRMHTKLPPVYYLGDGKQFSCWGYDLNASMNLKAFNIAPGFCSLFQSCIISDIDPDFKR